MDVLAVIHGDEARSGIFAPAAEARGHAIEEWSIGSGSPPPRPLDHYGAVIVFGGAMHADQDHLHPWLRDENLLLEELLDRHVPLLGVCLGAQLIARAAGGRVGPVAGARGRLVPRRADAGGAHRPGPRRAAARFEAFQWHYYTYELPPGAVELARVAGLHAGVPARRRGLGHPVPPRGDARADRGLVREDPEEGEEIPGGPDALLEATRPRIERWNELGRTSAPASSRPPRACGPRPKRRSRRRRTEPPSSSRSAGSSAWRDHSCQEPG